MRDVARSTALGRLASVLLTCLLGASSAFAAPGAALWQSVRDRFGAAAYVATTFETDLVIAGEPNSR